MKIVVGNLKSSRTFDGVKMVRSIRSSEGFEYPAVLISFRNGSTVIYKADIDITEKGIDVFVYDNNPLRGEALLF